MSENFDHHRREFLSVAAMALAASEFATSGSAEARSATHAAPVKTGMHTSFAPLKQIDAGLLNVGYAEAGPANGPVVLLLHGWPYDIYSFVDVAPLLAHAGYRVIVPYLRGYGTTRFLSTRPSSPGLIGAHVPPTSSRRCGRNAARASSP